ncbi:CBS domain-containing protein [Bradyrhizobium sp. S3.9.2]|uniref:bifunctional DNA primase/polymerase n=1 Tax=Bradyrhizobium sp. S3.9.2 TaxID=3156432 RepID=UPI003395C9EE
MTALALNNDDTNDIADLRRKLIENGYPHIPVLDKGPRIPGWAKKRITAGQVDGYLRQYPDHTRTGILCGNDLVAIDIDTPSEAVSEKLIERMTEIVPVAARAPRRTDKAPKCLFLFRATEPGDKSVTPEFMIEGAKHQVEVLRDGQQFVAM